MKNRILDIIEDELFLDNIDVEVSGDSIYWKDNFGAENQIDIWQAAINENVVAWWQRNGVGKELVRIKLRDDMIVNWRPPINTMGTGSLGANFMEFHLDLLVVKYMDKHRERIFVINTHNLKVEEIVSQGYLKKMRLMDDRLFIKDNPDGKIWMVTLDPNNITTEEIDEAYITSRNIDLS